MPRLFCEAWNRRDAAGIADLFDDDADFVNVVGIWWRNKGDIREAHDYGLKVIFKDSVLMAGKITRKDLGTDVAIIHARMHLKGQTVKENKKTLDRYTIFTFVMHKKGDDWTCAAAQNTDIIPGAETNISSLKGKLKGISYRKN